jgi:magnesium-transporting ATPase (P-type)
VVLLSAVFTLVQEASSAAAVAGFGRLVPATCIVLRSGTPRRVRTSALVVGDVVQLGVGQRVPADLRLAAAAHLRVDKSVLTGESEPVAAVAAPVPPARRTQQQQQQQQQQLDDPAVTMLSAPNMAFMGTSVSVRVGYRPPPPSPTTTSAAPHGHGAVPVRGARERSLPGPRLTLASPIVPPPSHRRRLQEGTGVGVVIATGNDNQIAKIAALASARRGVTSLQAELNRFVAIIASFSLSLGAAVILVRAGPAPRVTGARSPCAPRRRPVPTH